jgi:hypothetical protein
MALRRLHTPSSNLVGVEALGVVHFDVVATFGTPVPWTDPSWVGVEQTRALVRQELLGP